MIRAFLLLSALLTGLTVQAATFTFTAIPDQDETQLRTRFDQVAAYLSRELGTKVRYIPVKSYAAAVSAFRNNQVQLAWFGGLSGVRARQLVPGSQAIAQGYEDQFFQTYIIANRETGISRSDALNPAMEGRTFTFGSKGSTSGRLMPEYFLREKFGKSPQELFSRVGFSGDHSRTIALVQSGAYDLGAVNYKVWERELAEGTVDPGKVQVIWTTPDYPDYQWSIRGDVDARWGEDFTARVTRALLTLDDPALLNAFPRSRFVPASNADYAPVERVARQLDLID